MKLFNIKALRNLPTTLQNNIKNEIVRKHKSSGCKTCGKKKK